MRLVLSFLITPIALVCGAFLLVVFDYLAAGGKRATTVRVIAPPPR